MAEGVKIEIFSFIIPAFRTITAIACFIAVLCIIKLYLHKNKSRKAYYDHGNQGINCF